MREIGKFLIQFFSTLLLLQKPRNCVRAACAWVFQQLAAEKRREEKMDVALFSPSSLFAEQDDVTVDEETMETCNGYVERPHQFPEMELVIREFAFHQLNANFLWPGTFSFAEWLMRHREWIERRRCIELGSGTGALAIFLRKAMNLDITTSDYNDQEIEDNIAYNSTTNGITPALPHIKHSWGDAFPIPNPDWDLILASDILLYVKQYSNLIKSLSVLLKSYKPKDSQVGHLTKNEQGEGTEGLPWPAFLMSWRRRIGKEDETIFFTSCENAGLEVKHLGSRVYCIKLR